MGVSNKEAGVLKGALGMLNLMGFDAFRVQSGAIQTKSGHWMTLAPEGTPDICARVPISGRRLMVETKRPKDGKHTDAQRAFAAAEIEGGGVCLLVNDLDKLQAALLRLLADPHAKLNLDGTPEGEPAPPAEPKRRDRRVKAVKP